MTPFPPAEADAIVVLGANHYASNPSVREGDSGFATRLRTAHAAWLYRNWRPLPIVASGGTGAPGDPRLADLMRMQLIASGVPDVMVSVENRSGDTHQNAVETARLLLPKGMRRIALVTEAYHMPRAERTFRKQGFEIVRAACCYRTLEERTLVEFLLPQEWAIRVSSQTLHEVTGLVWYKLSGRI